MKNNKILFRRFLKSTLFFVGIFLLKNSLLFAQPYTSCGTTNFPYFSASAGICNLGLGINVSGCINCPYTQSWSVSGVSASGASACIPVPSPGQYTVFYTLTDPKTNLSAGSASCTLIVPDPLAQNVSYLPNVKPSTPIKKIIDTNLPVGTIKGSNSVTLTGGASYNIPIAVPKGTAGAEPSLSIAYGSQVGIGLMGMGWSLGVGSGISRVPKDLYHDDAPSAPSTLYSDAYALDGNRLILLSGNYGADGSTYGTKSETFSKITRQVEVNKYDNFIVETKSGLIMEYGVTYDSKIGYSKNRTYTAWQLNKVTDPNGNYIEYKYLQKNNNVLLQEINYTGNENAGIKPYNKIRFEYDLRQDANVGYVAYSSIAMDYLLTSITITAEGQLFRKYKFDYVFDNIHSYLRTARVAGSDNVFLNATEFQYGDNEQEFYADKISINNSVIGIAPYYNNTTGDFNGDGLSDLLQLKYNVVNGKNIFESFKALTKNQSGNTFNTANTQVTLNQDQQVFYEANDGIAEQINFISQDFNGDGFDDVPVANIDRDVTGEFYQGVSGQWIKTYSPYYIKTIDVHHSRGDGNFNPPISYAASVGNYKYEANSTSQNFIITGDFDGDSKADYVTILSNGTDFKAFVSFPNNNNLNNEITGSVTLPVVHPYSSTYLGTALSKANFVKSIDFNGDGKSEICVVRDNWISIVEITLNNGAYKGTEIKFFQIPKNTNINNINFGDFNGDRKTDMLLSSTTDSKSIHKVYLSSGFDYIPSFDIDVKFNEDINISDFDGNGMSDICFTLLKNTNIQDKAGNWTIKQDYQYTMYYSKGIDFFKTVNSYSNTIPGQYTTVAHEQVAAIGDFDGDGKSEIMSVRGVHASFFSGYTQPSFRKSS